MDNDAMMIGKAMIVCAVDNGYFDGVNMDMIEELADVERDMFIGMFRKLEKYRADEKRDNLTTDEISSLFFFVFARSVESVVNFYNGNKQEIDYMGMFDGKIPFFCDDKLTGFVKRSLFPKIMAEGFLDFMHENKPDMNPLLALFEALKWTWRISQHLAVQELG